MYSEEYKVFELYERVSNRHPVKMVVEGTEIKVISFTPLSAASAALLAPEVYLTSNNIKMGAPMGGVCQCSYYLLPLGICIANPPSCPIVGQTCFFFFAECYY